MSDGEPASERGRTSVGVVAPAEDEPRITEAVTESGGVAFSGPAEAVTDAEAVVAVGDAALCECVAASVSAPVLVIDADENGSLASENARAGIERLLAGELPIREHPVVAIETPTERGRALFDAALVTATPASISEFAVHTDGSDTTAGSGVAGDTLTADEPLARFRADGVVVATPIGSQRYARAAGGPIVVAGTDAAVVVPVSPFATDPDRWVVPLSGLTLTVERDDDVELFADGTPLGTLASGETVRLARDGTFRLAVPESMQGGRLERL